MSKLTNNLVIAGDYKNRPVVVVFGKVYILTGLKERIKISSETVESCQLLDEGKTTGSIGRAAVGGILFGGVGAVVGANSSNKRKAIVVDVRFKDGKKSLIECDDTTYRWLTRVCY